MAELIVVGFKQDMYRASEVLNTLQDMNNTWVVDLHDAVAVYRDYQGKLRVDQSYQMTTNEGAAWGGLLGGLLGAILAMPFTAGASGAAAAALAAGALSGGALGATAGAIDAESWKEYFGISEDFVDRVGSMVQPGDSAIFAMLRSIDPELVAAQFKGYGGTILRTSLNADQRAKVEATLHSRLSPQTWNAERATNMATTKAQEAPTHTLKAYADKIVAQLQGAKAKLDQIDAKAKQKVTPAEATAVAKLKTAKQNIDRKLQDLKTTHATNVARAKATIDADLAKFKATIDQMDIGQ